MDRILVLSDVHLGWAVCETSHRTLLSHLPAAVDDAELVILNGDIVDDHRARRGTALVDDLASLVADWRREGRTVVVIEGNHDPKPNPLGPTVRRYQFRAGSERVLALHGHSFDDAPFVPGPYERFGRHVLAAENWLYTHALPRSLYPYGPHQFVGAWGRIEDVLWRRDFAARLAPLVTDVDMIVYGHFHFGPGRMTLAGLPAWRSGAWVADGHHGTVNRMLRYRNRRWERIALERGRWVATDDGR